MDLIRFITAGNVDDGKSTLIGRLLQDSDAIPDDQMAAIRSASTRHGHAELNLALLTDGLKAEREQGITIDVAYRYFGTKRRKFIMADCPGHIQYTRNMVTGASTANLALVLVDVRKGIVEQTRRHCFVASLLRIPHIVICVNKMDLVDYAEEAFEKVRKEFQEFSKKLEVHDVTFIPMSALHGDNIVDGSTKMPWYRGRTVLGQLEEVHIASDVNLIDFRFPVQSIIWTNPGGKNEFRGYAGSVVSGTARVGDEVVALPSGFRSKIRSIEVSGKKTTEAQSPVSAVLQLEGEIDLGRGDCICRDNNRPQMGQDIEAIMCWFDNQPMRKGVKYILRHTTSEAVVAVKEVSYKFDINSLSRIFEGLDSIGLNEFARIKFRVSKPLLFDSYKSNRATGSFILIDPDTNATVAGAMIV